jgi:hypothetical protein
MSCRMQGESSGCFPRSRRQQPGAKQAGHHLKPDKQSAAYLSGAANLCGRGSVTFQIYPRKRDTIEVSAYAVRIGGASCFQP